MNLIKDLKPISVLLRATKTYNKFIQTYKNKILDRFMNREFESIVKNTNGLEWK